MSAPAAPTVDWNTIWGVDVQAVVCEHCNSVYLASADLVGHLCPNCYQDQLDPLDAQADELAYTQPPELSLPFKVGVDQATQSAARLAEGMPYPPKDLNSTSLRERMQRLLLPMWLVDSDVKARWQGEAGSYYEVVTHRDHLSGGSWQSREEKQRKTRWEPRVGELARHYDNVAAPALEGFLTLEKRIGAHDLSASQAYTGDALAGAFVRLPNRPPDDAWAEATQAMAGLASADCRTAAASDEFRNFRWTAEYANQNWTQLLIPVYTTFYRDDAGTPRLIFVNGQSGRVWGERRASMKRARGLTFGILAGAGVIGLISLLLLVAVFLFPPVAILGVLGLLIAAAVGAGGLIPVIRASRFNTSQDRSS